MEVPPEVNLIFFQHFSRFVYEVLINFVRESLKQLLRKTLQVVVGLIVYMRIFPRVPPEVSPGIIPDSPSRIVSKIVPAFFF